jgi:hypothetical protein
LDIYGFSDATAFVPRSRLWDCQAPAAADAGLRVVVCSMFAVHIPRTIPPAGTPGGPPPVEARRLFLGFPVEMRQMFLGLYRRPEDMPKAMAEIQASFQKELQKRRKK